MKIISLLATLLLCCSGLTLAQEAQQAPTFTPLNMPEGQTRGQIKGNIEAGKIIPMRWAESSSVALVPATRFEQFNGKQVFYAIALPANSYIKLKMVPEKNKKINLYALRESSQGDLQIPPNVTSVISSEASYPIYANLGNGRQVRNRDKGYREVEYISTNRSYSIVIGVAGAEGEVEGDFTLDIEIGSR